MQIAKELQYWSEVALRLPFIHVVEKPLPGFSEWKYQVIHNLGCVCLYCQANPGAAPFKTPVRTVRSKKEAPNA